MGEFTERRAAEIGIPYAVARAILQVESGGRSFADDGRMIIRFEPHIFYRQTDRHDLSEKYFMKALPKSVKRIAENKYKKTTNAFLFSIFGFLIIIGLMLFINLYYSPGTIWFVYPLFAAIWWPLSMFFRWLNRRNKR